MYRMYFIDNIEQLTPIKVIPAPPLYTLWGGGGGWNWGQKIDSQILSPTC